MSIKCAEIDPTQFQLFLGDDQPSMSHYNFTDSQAPLSVSENLVFLILFIVEMFII